MADILRPFLLSLIAGSATGLGGLLVILFNKISDKLMGFLMGFAGGVMLIISFLKLFNEALTIINVNQVTILFAIGALSMMALDLALPHIESGTWEEGFFNPTLFKSGIMIAIGMSMHNFPEGLIISTSFSHLPKLGLLITVIICLHNIPEGIATAAPLTLAGVKKSKAALIALLSGMTEPIGALLGSTLLHTFGGGERLIGYGLALAAGVMTYITVDELIPLAHEYCIRKEKHMVSIGLLLGMIFAQIVSIAFDI